MDKMFDETRLAIGMKRFLIATLCVLSIFCTTDPAAGTHIGDEEAPPVLVMNGEDEAYRKGVYGIGPYMTTLLGPAGDLTIEQVSSDLFISRFKRLSGDEQPYDAKNVIWVRLTIRNQLPDVETWLVETS